MQSLDNSDAECHFHLVLLSAKVENGLSTTATLSFLFFPMHKISKILLYFFLSNYLNLLID